MSHSLVHRCCLDPAVLWLWCRPAAAADLTPSLETSVYCQCANPIPQKKKKKIVGYYIKVKMNESNLYISAWMNVINVTFTTLKVSIRIKYSIYISFKNEKIQQLFV